MRLKGIVSIVIICLLLATVGCSDQLKETEPEKEAVVKEAAEKDVIDVASVAETISMNPSIDDQLSFLADRVGQWAWQYDHKEDDEYYGKRIHKASGAASYCVTDLNQNGRIEILTTEMERWNIMEIDEQGTALNHLDPRHCFIKVPFGDNPDQDSISSDTHLIFKDSASELFFAFSDRHEEEFYLGLRQNDINQIIQEDDLQEVGKVQLKRFYPAYSDHKNDNLQEWVKKDLINVLKTSWEGFEFSIDDDSFFENLKSKEADGGVKKQQDLEEKADPAYNSALSFAEHRSEWAGEYYEGDDDILFFFDLNSDGRIELLKDSISYRSWTHDDYHYTKQTMLSYSPVVNDLEVVLNVDVYDNADTSCFPTTEKRWMNTYQDSMGNAWIGVDDNSTRAVFFSKDGDIDFCSFDELNKNENKLIEIPQSIYGLERDKEPQYDFRRMDTSQVVEILYPYVKQLFYDISNPEAIDESQLPEEDVVLLDGYKDETASLEKKLGDGKVIYTYKSPVLIEAGVKKVEIKWESSPFRFRDLTLSLDLQTKNLERYSNTEWIMGGVLYCKPSRRMERGEVIFYYDEKKLSKDRFPGVGYVDNGTLIVNLDDYKDEEQGYIGQKILDDRGYCIFEW